MDRVESKKCRNDSRRREFRRIYAEINGLNAEKRGLGESFSPYALFRARHRSFGYARRNCAVQKLICTVSELALPPTAGALNHTLGFALDFRVIIIPGHTIGIKITFKRLDNNALARHL